MRPRVAKRQEVSNPQVAGSNPAGDATSAVLPVRKASHRRASSDARRDRRCEPIRARCMRVTAPMPPAPAHAVDRRRSSESPPLAALADEGDLGVKACPSRPRSSVG